MQAELSEEELVEVVGMRKLEVKRLQRGLSNVDL